MASRQKQVAREINQVLHFAWRRKDMNFRTVLLASLILVGIGFALTFPPIFKIAAPG
jgi:hypothetical protein